MSRLLHAGETHVVVKEYGDPTRRTDKVIKIIHMPTGCIGIGFSKDFSVAQATASDMVQSQLEDVDDSRRALLKKVRGIVAEAHSKKSSEPLAAASLMELARMTTLGFISQMSHVDNHTAIRLANLSLGRL